MQNVASLAQTCKNIRGLTHVSSAFVSGGSSPENPSPERLVVWRTPEGRPADAEDLAQEFMTLKPSRLKRRVGVPPFESRAVGQIIETRQAKVTTNAMRRKKMGKGL